MAVSVNLEDTKKALLELFMEKPDLFKDMIREILIEEGILDATDKKRVQKIIEYINEDFDKYGKVFKKLA